jgi:AcrR family transcriptional regulator
MVSTPARLDQLVGPDQGSSLVRQRIADAGRELYLAQGYEQTTVEAIAERAGVARRTFFRYFRSKDDVIFADHDRIAQVLAAHLAALDDLPPVRAVCSGARMIFRSYAEHPEVSVQRYRLVRSVPALRDREIASVAQYTRLFARYLSSRLSVEAAARSAAVRQVPTGQSPDSGPDVGLAAATAAAAVVAAHNHVLRTWLRQGGIDDPYPALDAAFAWVLARFEPLGD